MTGQAQSIYLLIMIRLNIDRIDQLRRRRGLLNQGELAIEAGLSPEHLSGVLLEARRGLPARLTLTTLDALCRALKTPPSRLLVYSA